MDWEHIEEVLSVVDYGGLAKAGAKAAVVLTAAWWVAHKLNHIENSVEALHNVNAVCAPAPIG